MICRMCGRGVLKVELDLGTAAFCVDAPHSVSAARAIPKHPFRLGGCSICGILQLIDLPPLEALQPPDKAILYRDPERHLDDLARVTATLLNSPQAFVMGLSYKDMPFLDRMRTLGFTHQRSLDRDEDWGFTDPRQGIETMQACCTVAWADDIRRKYGRVDLLLVRHVLEHSHDPPAFLAACRRLIEPNGLVLFEVPGCETEFARGDAGALWEEHVSYFTAESLRRALTQHGFQPQLVGNYPYTVEDCLAVVARCWPTFSPVGTASTTLLAEFDRAQTTLRKQVVELAHQQRQQGRGLAVYGAGHRTATWLELAGLTDVVTCVIDDDPAKQGRYLAGSGIQIGPARMLQEKSIGIGIGLLSADILRKIAAREADYVNSGGRFMTLDDILIGEMR